MKILAIMLKDLRLVTRDRSAFAFLLAVPIVVIMVVAETNSGGGTKSILFPVVNEDQGPVANALIKVFSQHLTCARLAVRPLTSWWQSATRLRPPSFCRPE
ncbi:MAG: hypothetical protein ACLQU2_22110 [Candidatus Binataceae bacterium]